MGIYEATSGLAFIAGVNEEVVRGARKWKENGGTGKGVPLPSLTLSLPFPAPFTVELLKLPPLFSLQGKE